MITTRGMVCPIRLQQKAPTAPRLPPSSLDSAKLAGTQCHAQSHHQCFKEPQGTFSSTPPHLQARCHPSNRPTYLHGRAPEDPRVLITHARRVEAKRPAPLVPRPRAAENLGGLPLQVINEFGHPAGLHGGEGGRAGGEREEAGRGGGMGGERPASGREAMKSCFMGRRTMPLAVRDGSVGALQGSSSGRICCSLPSLRSACTHNDGFSIGGFISEWCASPGRVTTRGADVDAGAELLHWQHLRHKAGGSRDRNVKS